MTPQDFTYWLQGFFEMRAADPEMRDKPLTKDQTDMIQRHLATVFNKVTLPEIFPLPYPLEPIAPTWNNGPTCTGNTFDFSHRKIC